MYNWRLRKEADETDASFAARLYANTIVSLITYFTRRGSSHSIGNVSLSKVVYCHSELGDDSYSGTDIGSPEHPYRSFSAISANSLTNTIVVAVGAFTGSVGNTNAIIADTQGSVRIDAVDSNASPIIYGCYVNMASSVSIKIRAYKCVVNCNNSSGAQNSGPSLFSTFLNGHFNIGHNMSCCTLLNCEANDLKFALGNGWNILVNSRISVTASSISLSNYNYIYNCEVNNPNDLDLKLINLSETYQSANDCFVDPIHLNFAVKRSEVRAGTPFSGWVGFTGDSVDFVKVTGNNIQSDSGSWTIDQQTPGEGRLLGAIIDNRGQFNNVFTGFNNVVFHYNSNNISIGPHEKFGTPVEVPAGENETLTITDGGMYCVSKDCEIDDAPVSKYQNIWLEAGSYSVDSSNGVKFFPYNYESINNYVGCRFTNLGKCTTYAAGRTLKANCSYINQGSADVTVSDGTVVAPGKTYVTPDQSAYMADGNLLLVFDDVVDNFVWFNTNSFQTKYKAGYVVVNSKTEQNLLTRDGKTIPCTEAFGEYNDIRYLASQNEQSDFFQVVVDYKVYPF